MEVKERSRTRYVGIDLGKRTYEMAIVGENGKVAMSNGKTIVAGRQALYKKLRPQDKVAVEAGNMAFIIAKEIEKAVPGCKVYVLNASNLALIYGSMKKTDKEDALKLAHILEDCREERLPLIPIPGDKEVRRRKILASYRRARKDRNRELNLLHGLFVSQGITTVVKKDLSDVEETVRKLNQGHYDNAPIPKTNTIKINVNKLRICKKHWTGDKLAQRTQRTQSSGSGDLSYPFTLNLLSFFNKEKSEEDV